MTNLVLSRTNGSAPHPHPVQMRQTVQQFFSAFNWENNPPEIQKLMQEPLNRDRPVSLALPVSQFFAATNWEGCSIATLPQPESSFPTTRSPAESFTLDDFSDLF